jgi:hypothetical protein
MAGAAKERRGGRHYLGKASGVALRQRVYRTREYLEIDEIDGYDVVRRRVFFDDVLLVTYHRFLGWPFVAMLGAMSAIFALITLAIAWENRRGDLSFALVFGAVSVLPFLVPLLLRLILMVDAVTVYGRRSRAQVHFPFRKARAREVYTQICRAVREQQERLARELARAERRAAPPAAAAPPVSGL